VARRMLFETERPVYWPSEFTEIANLLKGSHPNSNRYAPLFKLNAGVVVFAGMTGLVRNRRGEIKTGRQEITTGTFEAHSLGGVSLCSYIFLIALLGGCNVESLRVEREEEILRTFEKYVAGGFEVIQEELSKSGDATGLSVVLAEIDKCF
jgi:hypothetical protein